MEEIKVPVGSEEQKLFEERYVKDVYRSISSHFSSTRYKAWPLVVKFVSSLEDGSVGLEIGCGNFKNSINPKIFISGLDNCMELLLCCPKKSDVICASALNIPYRSESQDFALSIAVIHHFCTPERRLQAVKELIRILRITGTALIFVWAYEQQNKRVPETQDNRVKWILDPQKSKTGKREVYERYYHMFNEGELENLILQCKNVRILNKGLDSGNWWAEIIRIS